MESRFCAFCRSSQPVRLNRTQVRCGRCGAFLARHRGGKVLAGPPRVTPPVPAPLPGEEAADAGADPKPKRGGFWGRLGAWGAAKAFARRFR